MAELEAEYAAAIERGMRATAELQGQLAEAEGMVVQLVGREQDIRAEVERLNERLSLCEVPDGWEAWRIKAEAEVERLLGAILMLREQLEDLDDRAWTPDERDARAILIAVRGPGENCRSGRSSKRDCAPQGCSGG